jgi:SAM-dependent methyltransferase
MAEADHARRTYEAFAPYYDLFTAHHRYDEWTATLERCARAAGLRGRRLLDVACGTGKSFLPFLDRGYEVTACDLSPAMLALASEKADGRARVLEADMRALPVLGSFDLVCCLDDAINYLLSEAELVEAFEGVRRNLAPGGIVVFDANTLLAFRTFFARIMVVSEHDRVLVWEGRASADHAAGDAAAATLLALDRGEGDWWTRREIAHLERHHDEPTVRRALASAGLECAAVHGMRHDGAIEDGFDELVNTKAVYVARAVRPAHAHRPGAGTACAPAASSSTSLTSASA